MNSINSTNSANSMTYERFQQKQEANASIKRYNNNQNKNILERARKVCNVKWSKDLAWSPYEYNTEIYWADGRVLIYDDYCNYVEDSSTMTIREVIARHAQYPLKWNTYDICVENVSVLDERVSDAQLCQITVKQID